MSKHLTSFWSLVFFFGFPSTQISAQSKPFVPLEYEYPPALLSSPKTYVYKNLKTGLFRYKDLAFERNDKDVIVHWKEYDNSPIADSATEINDKTFDHYMLMNSSAIKAVVGEDSVYSDGSKLGERVQTFYFNLSMEISLFGSVRSSFLKDTAIVWKGNLVPCLVIQSYQMQRLTNSLFPDKPKEMNGVIYYYFGKDVGLLMYRSESEEDRSTWQLTEIKKKGEK
ncbi:MAG: hypothetical protein ACXVLT_02735 [Flavisolibacter sp.]